MDKSDVTAPPNDKAILYIAYSEEMHPYRGDIIPLSVENKKIQLTVERFANDEGVVACKLDNGFAVLLPKSTWIHLVGKREFMIDDRSDKKITYSETCMPREGDLALHYISQGIPHYAKVLQDVLHPNQMVLVQGEERRVNVWNKCEGIRRS